MKRSLILKKIYDYLDRDLNIDMEPEWVEEILDICEQAGMLPPRHDFMMGSTKCSDNAWEPETEE